MNWKLAHELRKRGRGDTTALRLEGLETLKDGALLKRLTSEFEPCVLATWDNKMPYVHRAELEHHGATVAVVSRAGLANWTGTEDSYIRDVIHRWLHRIEAQPAACVRAYSSAGTPVTLIEPSR